MREMARLKIGPVALLVLLALLTLLIVKRAPLTPKQAEHEAVQTVVQIEEGGVRDQYAAVASLLLTAVFAFVGWASLETDFPVNTLAKPQSITCTSCKLPP